MAVSFASVAMTDVSSPASSDFRSRSAAVSSTRRWAAPSRRARSPASSRPATWMRSACSSATTSPWRRAASAWRSSGRSWRRTSRSRSWRRVRLPSVASRRRSLFSLRRRYFRTPAASSMIERRSSGRALRTASIWPWLMITCCWRPTPLSLSSSWMSSSRHGTPFERVLAVTAAEQGAGDGHLVELDGQHARRVVDGERDLGPAQRAALGRAREDHVVHLLAAHRTGGLGTQHPTDGVDHVGLAAAVGAHHHGDARFEVESRCVSERLEPLEGQGLEIHTYSAVIW